MFEKMATPEQVERARKLHLPDNFYLYDEASSCPGCRGCEDDTSDEDEVSVLHCVALGGIYCTLNPWHKNLFNQQINW